MARLVHLLELVIREGALLRLAVLRVAYAAVLKERLEFHHATHSGGRAVVPPDPWSASPRDAWHCGPVMAAIQTKRLRDPSALHEITRRKVKV